MIRIISVEGYTIELRTNDLAHSIYSERDDQWTRLKEVVTEQVKADVKEWKDAGNHNR